MTQMWIGTYPVAGAGTPAGLGEGLWHASVDTAAGGAAIVTAVQATAHAAASYVVAHPSGGLVYAVEETDASVVRVISTNDGREVASVNVGGAGGCHLLLSADARTLYACTYVSGELAVILLDAAGLPLDEAPQQVWRHEGNGPREDRQDAPHAHSASFSPCGRYVLVCDLGTDELRRYRIVTEGLLDEPGIGATLPPGSGPRIVATRGELLYMVCELDHQMRVLRWDRGSAQALVIDTQPLTLVPGRDESGVFGAHVAVMTHPRSDVLLVSVRGKDVVSVFDIAPEGELTYRAAFQVGAWPRHFALTDTHLIVGAERGHVLQAFTRADIAALPPERERGAVATLAATSTDVPSPACVCVSPVRGT